MALPLRSLASRTLESLGLLEQVRKARGSLRYASSNTAHVLEECMYRLPNPVTRARLGFRVSPDTLQKVKTLRKDGIIALPNYYQGERLREQQEYFNTMVGRIKDGPPSAPEPAPAPWDSMMVREQEHDPEIQTISTRNPFRHSAEFLKIAMDEAILDIIELYFGRRCMMNQAFGSRYEPTERNGFASWQWHHDAWGKRLNVMVLFTDVTEKDQYMSFMKGSHRLIHSKDRTINSRFTETEVGQFPQYPRFDCLGSAGSVFIFDSNGFHRGNRSLGSHRDAQIVDFSCGRFLWKFEIPKAHYAALSPRQQEFLMRNPRVCLI